MEFSVSGETRLLLDTVRRFGFLTGAPDKTRRVHAGAIRVGQRDQRCDGDA